MFLLLSDVGIVPIGQTNDNGKGSSEIRFRRRVSRPPDYPL